MKIQIVCPALPPRLDGIGDYTALLAAHLSQSASVQVLTSRDEPHNAIANVDVKAIFDRSKPQSFRHLETQAALDQPDWVLLQYNPFSYGKWGLNLQLPLIMRRIKRDQPRTRFALMAHETFVPAINWKFAAMTLWQRWQLWMLGRAADKIFFPIDAWARDLAVWFPGKTPVHLPVGSNIPLIPTPRAEARAALGVGEDTFVIGLFGAPHISRLRTWSLAASKAVAQTGRDILVVNIGPGAPEARALFHPLPIRAEGPLAPAEISRRFAAMDIFLSPFSDGVSTRRGSFMTALQHGVPGLTTCGIHTDPVFRRADGEALLLADARDPEGYCVQALALLADGGRRQAIGRAGQRLFNDEFTWDRITQTLLEELA